MVYRFTGEYRLYEGKRGKRVYRGKQGLLVRPRPSIPSCTHYRGLYKAPFRNEHKTNSRSATREDELTAQDDLTQQLQLVEAQRDKLALEVEILCLQQTKPPEAPPSDGDKAFISTARKQRNVDWPKYFTPGTSSNLDYSLKLDIAEFIAGYLAMIKTHDPEAITVMLCHLELLSIKAICSSWSSVRAFHAHG